MSWADVGCCRKAGVGCSSREGNGVPDLEGPQQHLGAYFVIPPNPARRNELQRIANKELEDLAKWKEQHKPGPITLKPQKLGGRATEAEVREKQQFEYSQSKYQQKLKKEDYERNKREAEEADLLKNKAIQRGKANKLEEQRRRQEWQRQQMLREDRSVNYTSKQTQRQEENRTLQQMKEEQRRKNSEPTEASLNESQKPNFIFSPS